MPLPIAAPISALGMGKRVGGGALELRAVVLPPHVLAPCHLPGVERQIDARDVVVLAVLGPAQPGEVALGLVGASAVVREGEAVIDALGVEPGVQRVPTRRLVGIHRVEYKGTHLMSGEDAKEKQLIGELWAERSDGKCLFLMVECREFSRIDNRIRQY